RPRPIAVSARHGPHGFPWRYVAGADLGRCTDTFPRTRARAAYGECDAPRVDARGVHQARRIALAGQGLRSAAMCLATLLGKASAARAGRVVRARAGL